MACIGNIHNVREVPGGPTDCKVNDQIKAAIKGSIVPSASPWIGAAATSETSSVPE